MHLLDTRKITCYIDIVYEVYHIHIYLHIYEIIYKYKICAVRSYYMKYSIDMSVYRMFRLHMIYISYIRVYVYLYFVYIYKNPLGK